MSQEKTIAELAYFLWKARGSPEGSSQVDWMEAERQVKGPKARQADEADGSLPGTFPASDPVASHLPDVPPANADAKWAAAGKARRS